MGDEKGDQSMFHNALKSLCCSYRWSYGAFWRFNPQNSLLLTMEDAYCEEQMGIIVDNMLLQVHMIGNGVVGQVAFTKRHRWMFSDVHCGGPNLVASEENQFSLEDDSDIHAQFCSGIETIALIYVESLGVIQFGSTLKIPETSEFVDQTKRLFQEIKELQTFVLAETMPSTSNSEIDGIMSSGISSFPDIQNSTTLASLENYMGTPCYSSNFPQLSPFTSDNGRTDSSYLGNQLLMGTADASFQSSNDFLQELLLNPTSYVNDSIASSPCIISTWSSLQSSLCSTIPNTLQAPFQEKNFTTAQLQTYPLEVPSLSSSSLNRPSNSVQSSIMDAFQFDDYDNCLNDFCAESDLFDDLGIDFDFGEDASFLDDILSPVVGGDHLDFSTYTSEYTSEQHVGMNELGLDHFVDSFGGRSRSIASSSFEDEFYSSKRRKISNCSVMRKSIEPVQNMGISHILEWKKGTGSLIGPSYSMTRGSSVVPLSKSSQKSFKAASRKKAKAGTRLKSPDRVVIDACISELRKIIPNGLKMSIVSLLAQTAKHVIFLQSMAKHAEKLKHIGGCKEYEVILKDKLGSSSDKCEVGDEKMLEPVQVKDLSCPGHKLIQVMFEENVLLSLEIVDIVEGLGLSILKGVMEVKENKLRALFLVEDERNMLLTNQQIYMSLRKLLLVHDQKATATSDGHLARGYNNFQQSDLLVRRRRHHFS